jgi:hypothetical protein
MPASTNMQPIARQQALLTHHTTIVELLEALFSMQSDPRLYNKDQQGKPGSFHHEPAAIQRVREHGSRGVSIVGSRYKATPGEDIKDLMCAAAH